jgi:hypothetical protein
MADERGCCTGSRAMSRRQTILILPLSVLVAVLLFAGGCDRAVAECDCAPGGQLTLDAPGPDLPFVELSSSGDGCRFAPFCAVPGDAGGCAKYLVQLTGAGGCHLGATTADGQQATDDLTVRVTGNGGCCGDSYATNRAPTLTFARPDHDGAADAGP